MPTIIIRFHVIDLDSLDMGLYAYRKTLPFRASSLSVDDQRDDILSIRMITFNRRSRARCGAGV